MKPYNRITLEGSEDHHTIKRINGITGARPFSPPEAHCPKLEEYGTQVLDALKERKRYAFMGDTPKSHAVNCTLTFKGAKPDEMKELSRLMTSLFATVALEHTLRGEPTLPVDFHFTDRRSGNFGFVVHFKNTNHLDTAYNYAQSAKHQLQDGLHTACQTHMKSYTR